ncbi:MAG TPA: hypothetical protein VGR07_13365 [Thermoanaerobaculia bacterium]|jgi:hypothetical protein|nr:hypothetical protein [Thermoanaerobaculia bacterium]
MSYNWQQDTWKITTAFQSSLLPGDSLTFGTGVTVHRNNTTFPWGDACTYNVNGFVAQVTCGGETFGITLNQGPNGNSLTCTALGSGAAIASPRQPAGSARSEGPPANVEGSGSSWTAEGGGAAPPPGVLPPGPDPILL